MSVTSRMSRRGPLIPTILVIAALVAAFTIFAEVWTQKLWFDSVAFPQVFSTQLLAQVLLFFVFAIVMGGVVGLNMWIAFRLRPTVRRTGQSAVLDRYRDLLESRVLLSILVPSIFFGVIAGVSAVSQAMEYLAWWNRTPFGVTDSYFGLDVGFYVFEYPIWQDLLSFILGALFFGLVAAAAVHFAVGGIVSGRARGRAARDNAARIHLSVLAGLHARRLRPAEPARPLRLPAEAGHAVHRHAVHRRARPAQREARHGRHRLPLRRAVLRQRLPAPVDARHHGTRPDDGLRPDPRPDLPVGGAELPGEAERAGPRAPLHPGPHRRHPPGVRHRQDRGDPVRRRHPGASRPAQAGRGGAAGHPVDRPGRRCAHLREPAAVARLLHVPRRPRR